MATRYPLVLNGTTIQEVQSTDTLPKDSLPATTVHTDAANTFTEVQTGLVFRETKVAVSASNIDLSAGAIFSKTIAGNTTFTLSNIGAVSSFLLNLTNGGAFTVTWWLGVKWAGGTAPTLTASGRDRLGFITEDSGTTWDGFVLGKDIK
jgi:hypothetical protein